MSKQKLHSELIKAEALRLGFSACGIALAKPVDEVTASFFRQWLTQGKQAGMNYMANHEEKRLDPRLLLSDDSPTDAVDDSLRPTVDGSLRLTVDGLPIGKSATITRSIISVALNYYPARLLDDDQYQIAWYAYGKDYHDVMKSKLNALRSYIESITPLPLQSRIFCDTAPVLERYWAWKAGLGWIGKNTQLIIPQAGSCFFLGEIFLDAEADVYDTPQADRCGNCTRCLQSCPTSALETPYLLNSNRCSSYLTIEHRGDLPPATGLKMANKIYGCDDCQRACPWNRFATPCDTPELQPSEEFMKMKKEDWEKLTEEQYRELFKGSAVKRAKYEGLKRNIAAASTE